MENNFLIKVQQNPTKAVISEAVDYIAQQIDDGNMDAVDVAVSLAGLETLVKELRQRIGGAVMDEVAKYPKSKAEFRGATISVVDTIKHDFSHIPQWVECQEIIDKNKEIQKEIEEAEKKWRRGELPVKSASSTFKVQLSK